MTRESTRERVAVVCDRDSSAAAAVASYLERERFADHADWFPPRDLDDVDRGVREGRFEVIVFDTLDTFTCGLWDEVIDSDAWLAAAPRITIVDPSSGSAAGAVERILASWRDWNRIRRRRKAAAGLVFTILAMSAGFAATHAL